MTTEMGVQLTANFSLQMKIPMPLLGRRITNSCKVTKTAYEYDVFKINEKIAHHFLLFYMQIMYAFLFMI